ncbi:MAG: dihydropteroate synthase [Deltaproteobacteria bacterium]|nr:dihydropteroate synthase [Deltaproteobacteria bacterium]
MGWRDVFPELSRRTLLMGVVNVTPDSFSDGGRFLEASAAIAHGRALADEGADIVDIGGESTRPGSTSISVEEELRRVLPVVEELAKVTHARVSIDTTKAEVARRAIEAGASIVNDVSGGTFDEALLADVSRAGALVVLMHTRARPSGMQRGSWEYEGGVVAAVRKHLAGSVEVARAAGIAPDEISVDPGIGFGKTVAENLELLRALRTFAELGVVLVGTSNKSFLGALTGREVEARGFATAASVALAISSGADIVRVHDVRAMRDVTRVADAFVREAFQGR